jgi:FkbM family methyltransferase
MSFVDVGANWGYFTLLAANLVGPTGRVLSLEPDPRLFTALEENIQRSRLDHVVALQLAAASEPSRLTLAGYDERSDNFGVSHIVTGSSEGKGLFQVHADSLDRLLKEHNLDSVDLMKMDIEGGEALALPGLEESLQKHRVKRLLLELHPHQIVELGGSVTAVMGQLEMAGYTARTIDHSFQATRRAAYTKSNDPTSWLRPFTIFDRLDAWPHQLWTAPDVK